MGGPEDPLSHYEEGLTSGSDDACQGRTDTDCDGLVTANDVLRLLRFLADDKVAQPSGRAEIGSQLLG